MVQHAIYLTPTELYAIAFHEGGQNEYWRVKWSVTTWAETIADVKQTLQTSRFAVVLSRDLPLLQPQAERSQLSTQTISSDAANLETSYTTGLQALGCEVLSTRVVAEDTPFDTVNSLLTDTQIAARELSLGSLADLDKPVVTTPHRRLKIILIILSAILVAGGTYLLFGQSLFAPNPAPSPAASTPTPLPSATLSPTPSATVPSPRNQDFTLKVENGTTIAGFGARATAKLEAAGFVVKDTSNANRANYEHAELALKPNTPQAISKNIMAIIIDAEWQTKALPEDSPYDVVITLGQQSELAN